MHILSYNIEYGGFEKKVNYMKYVKLVQKYKIDVFIATEPFLPKINDTQVDYNSYGENTIEKVAKELGYFYTTIDRGATIQYPITIISRYKIEPTNHDFVFDLIHPLYRIKIIPIHLIDYPFTFYSLRNIPYQNTPTVFKDKKEVVDLSYSTKSTEIEKILDFIKRNPNEKIIIAGDFNEPSHLDDTYEWIISKKFEENGLIDSYRRINKKVVLDKLGYNTDGATCCNLLDKNEPLNRVDYIYTKNLKVLNSSLLKEYSHYSDHLPLSTEVEITDKKLNYGYKYMKYKLKYYELIMR
jgi:hypothetical protein